LMSWRPRKVDFTMRANATRDRIRVEHDPSEPL
jgi:hypothetical protein